ncbi:MAG: hypothetical protein M1837_005058 [Sclerophora amabilis]|nr:MAG: hypothetical protein M1837_005058 [Sclerophora amabilis]
MTSEDLDTADGQNSPSEAEATTLRIFNPAHVDYGKFKSDLQHALDTAMAPKARQYSAVRCLLLCWEEDKIGCSKEVRELGDVFTNRFGFDTEEFKIPSKKPFKELQFKLSALEQKSVEKNELIIIYYGGHAGKDNAGRAIWSCGASDKISLKWYILQDTLEESTSDILFIFDCCNAASAARGAVPGRKELLASCGWEHRTPMGVESKTSYTAVLIRELRRFGKPFTVNQLHSALVREKGRDVKILEKTPFHCLLSEDLHQIVFYPRISSVPRPHDLIALEESVEIPTSFEMTDSNYSSSHTSSSTALSSMPEEYPRLLISVSFNGTPNSADFERWLTSNLPRNAGTINCRLERQFPSNSTLVLVSVPIPIWTSLPQNAAYVPISMINGPGSR